MEFAHAMRTYLPSSSLAAVALGLALGLCGCVTQASKPVLSRAVVDARAHRDVDRAATCGPLSSPVSIGFAFGEPALSELAIPALEGAGQQLACHPEAAVLVVGQADGHGTAAEQHQLAQVRAGAVAQDLRGRGVAAGRIQTQVEGDPPTGDARRLVVMAEGRRW
jgi:outer membrane protein OmpA-like peptidoglycan-associated protein